MSEAPVVLQVLLWILGGIAALAGASVIIRGGLKADDKKTFEAALVAQNATIEALKESSRLQDKQIESQRRTIQELRDIVHRLEGRAEERSAVLLELVTAVAQAAVCEKGPECPNYVAPGATVQVQVRESARRLG